MTEKVLITGGSGFIGSHLVVGLLEKNYQVIVLDNLSSGRRRNLIGQFKKIKFYHVDISKKGKWEKLFKNVDYVFHLAALADIVPSIDNPKKYFDSNVVGTLNLLEACRNYGIKKLIYSASSSCYGLTKKYPTSEEDSIDPKYPYALTKRLGEEMIIHWSNLYKINFVSLRLFNVYGTRSRTSGAYGAMFGVFLTQKIFKKPLTIVGDGKQSRDFIYVEDCINVMLWLYKNPKISWIFNVGTGKSRTFLDLAKIMFKNLKKKEKIKYIKAPNNILKHYQYYTKADMRKLKKVGYLKKFKILEDGIKCYIKKQ